MKAASINELKRELEHGEKKELVSFCMRLAKFKKENKELLTFLLFEIRDITAFIESTKIETTELFESINNANVYYTKKSLRKILRMINKHIKFAESKQAEAELLIHFHNCIKKFSIPVHKSRQLLNIQSTVLNKIETALSSLHPDLQYDLKKQMIATV